MRRRSAFWHRFNHDEKGSVAIAQLDDTEVSNTLSDRRLSLAIGEIFHVPGHIAWELDCGFFEFVLQTRGGAIYRGSKREFKTLAAACV